MMDCSNLKEQWQNSLALVDQFEKSRRGDNNDNKVLPADWGPNNWTVLCGRGRDCYDSIGNRRLRVVIDIYTPKYAAATTKHDKSAIVMDVVNAIRDNAGVGAFIRKDRQAGRWVEVGDEVAREKVGQQFRAAIKSNEPVQLVKGQKRQRRGSERRSISSKEDTIEKQTTPQKVQPISPCATLVPCKTQTRTATIEEDEETCDLTPIPISYYQNNESFSLTESTSIVSDDASHLLQEDSPSDDEFFPSFGQRNFCMSFDMGPEDPFSAGMAV